MIIWNINPEIFTIGPFTLRWYALLFALSFYLGLLIITKIYKREGKPVEDLSSLLIYMILGATIGARLGHCLFYNPSYYLSHPLEIFQTWKGGLASHGGAIGIIISLYLYSRKKSDQPFLWLLDRVVIPTALGGALIRVGNLFNSEIIGKPTELPWGFVFTSIDNIPRHPAQIYEALAYLFIFVVLIFFYEYKLKDKPHGSLLGLFLVLVFSFRFLIEFLKENQTYFEKDMVLDMGQLLSLPFILTGIILLYNYYNHNNSVSN